MYSQSLQVNAFSLEIQSCILYVFSNSSHQITESLEDHRDCVEKTKNVLTTAFFVHFAQFQSPQLCFFLARLLRGTGTFCTNQFRDFLYYQPSQSVTKSYLDLINLNENQQLNKKEPLLVHFRDQKIDKFCQMVLTSNVTKYFDFYPIS